MNSFDKHDKNPIYTSTKRIRLWKPIRRENSDYTMKNIEKRQDEKSQIQSCLKAKTYHNFFETNNGISKTYKKQTNRSGEKDY